MLIKQNTATTLYFLATPGDAVNPVTYAVFKNGGGGVAGTGTAGVLAAVGNGTLYGANLSVGDVDTLGQLYVVINQAGVNWAIDYPMQVVPDVPGATVQDVLGDVQGNLVGNLLGSMTPAMRLQIAAAVMTMPDAVELGMTFQNFCRVVFAVLAGKSHPLPGIVTFRNFGDTITRCTVQFNASQGRWDVTYDFS